MNRRIRIDATVFLLLAPLVVTGCARAKGKYENCLRGEHKQCYKLELACMDGNQEACDYRDQLPEDRKALARIQPGSQAVVVFQAPATPSPAPAKK
jgi:hypothetical protein